MTAIRAYSCRPFGAEWHLVVFADTGQRARLLGFYSDPESDSDFIQWRARRLPEADGLCANEAVWTHAGDAPEEAQAKAALLWSEVD
jgi:hypothetical protein